MTHTMNRERGEPPDEIDRDAIAATLRSFPIDLAFLFGSQSTGTAGPLSDVDVAVTFEPDIDDRRRRELLDEITAVLVTSIGRDAIDLIDLDDVSPRLGYEVLHDGEQLLGDPSEATAMEVEFLLEKLDFEPVLETWRSTLETRIAEGTYGRS